MESDNESDIKKEFLVVDQTFGAVQTVGDTITPFVPLFSMVTNISEKTLSIHKNAECNEKICMALLDRVEIAQTAVKSLQRKYQAYEEYFRNQDYYNTWVKFVNVLDNIRKFAEEVTQLSCLQRVLNPNTVKYAFEKNIKEFEEVCSDLSFTIALYNPKQREMEQKDVAKDLEIMKRDGFKSEISLVIKEITSLISNANYLASQINNVQHWGGKIDVDKMRPLNEEYKAPRIDPSELKEPYTSNDNVRGSGKTIHSNSNLDQAKNKKQQMELAALLKLDCCPFIIKFYGISSVDNSQVMVYDWAAFGNLHETYLKFDIGWPTKLQFARDIFNGLFFMHQSNIYHHDVRCENILVTDGFEPKISNFQLARSISTPVSSEIKTLADIIRWLAPEKMRRSAK
ncbi:12966_t:CDS:2, partial [Dentiscutata heterogama]